MAVTVTSSKRAPIPGSTVVAVIIEAAADGTGEATISADLIPAGVAWQLAAVTCARTDGSATAWAPQVALDGRLLYLATSSDPTSSPDLGDTPRMPFIRGEGAALVFAFGWGSGTDNDATAELVFVPVLGA